MSCYVKSSCQIYWSSFPCSWAFPKCVESPQNELLPGIFSTPNIGVGNVLEKGRLGMRDHPRVAPVLWFPQILGNPNFGEVLRQCLAQTCSTSPDNKEVLPWLIIHVSLFHHVNPVYNLKFKPLMPREKAIICSLRRRSWISRWKKDQNNSRWIV